MRILLDTHMLIWWLDGDPALPSVVNQELSTLTSEVFVSAVALAEISVKRSVGKLKAPWVTDELLIENGLIPLAFSTSHARRMLELPLHHRDPFDRMLIAQALHDDLVFATVDSRAARYGVRTVPAA